MRLDVMNRPLKGPAVMQRALEQQARRAVMGTGRLSTRCPHKLTPRRCSRQVRTQLAAILHPSSTHVSNDACGHPDSFGAKQETSASSQQSVPSSSTEQQSLQWPNVLMHLATRRVMHYCSVLAAAVRSQKIKTRWRMDSNVCMLSLLASPILPGGPEELLNNRIFWGSFWAWLTAQTLKIFTKKYKTGIWDWKAIFDSGGMPSSHSAMCAGLTTSLALEYGLGSPLFAIALCFTSIVMYDACGVRRHAGRTAEHLNKVIDELMAKDHPMTAIKLKEVLGHTPRQVAAGAALGVFMAAYLPLPYHPIPLAPA